MPYDEAQLSQALINADKAGDTAAAQMLAGEIQKLRMGPMVNKPAPADLPMEPRQGAVLPLSRDPQGNMQFDSDAGLFGMLKRAVTAPGDALTGKMDPMSDEGIGRAFDLAGMASPMSTATRATAQMVKTIPKAPTRAELAAATDSGYSAMRDAGVGFKADAMRRFADDLEQKLWSESHSAKTDEKTFALLDELRAGPEGSTLGLDFLDKLRSKASTYAKPTHDESLAATKLIKEIDGFLNGATEADIVVNAAPSTGRELALPGDRLTATRISDQASALDPQTAIQALKEARGNAAAGFRSDDITGLADKADLQAAAIGSGTNLGNKLRQRLVAALTKEGGTRGYSPEEIAAAEQIIMGTRATNTARDIGNKLAGGGGAVQTGLATLGATVGSALAGPTGLIVGGSLPYTAGAGARGLANALTKRQVGQLDELIRSRSPLYESMKKNAPWEADTPDKRAALARALVVFLLDKESN